MKTTATANADQRPTPKSLYPESMKYTYKKRLAAFFA